MQKLIAPESVDPGSTVSVQQQTFKVGRDRTVEVPEPLVKHLIDVGFKSDYSRIPLVGTGGRTSSLADAINEGAKTPSTSTTKQQDPAAPSAPAEKPLAEMTEDEKAAKIKADAEKVLADLSKELGQGDPNVQAAAEDAKKVEEGAPSRAVIQQ